MPPPVRGSVHWYDFGPIVGNELSGIRPALIVSNSELNRSLSVAIAVPMSSTVPPGRYLRNHVFIEAADSWASVRQIKTIDQSRLGERIATAGHEELEEMVEKVVQRLGKRRSAGAVRTSQGAEQIGAGTLMAVDFQDEHGSAERTEMLALDFNRGNEIAIAVEIERRTVPNSPVRIPIEVIGGLLEASALVHRVRSIDVGARDVHLTGHITEESLISVGKAFLATVDE